MQSFVRLKGDREEVADLILTLNGCLLGSGQRNTQERTYRNRLLDDWLEYQTNAEHLCSWTDVLRCIFPILATTWKKKVLKWLYFSVLLNCHCHFLVSESIIEKAPP